MNKTMKIGLLSLIAIMQVSTTVGGFLAYLEMSGRLHSIEYAYKELYELLGGIIIDFGVESNPFLPLIPLVFLGLFSTLALLIDEVRHKNAGD